MKNLILTLIILALACSGSMAQNVGINTDGSTPETSAMLDVKSTAKGFLAPRMTAAQRIAITTPATGLSVFQTDGTAGFYYYNGSTWTQIGNASGATQWTTAGSNIYYNSGNVGIGTTTPSSKLHIAGADMNNALLFENTSANPGRNYILFKTLGTEQGYIGLGGGATNHMSVAAYGASNNLFLETNGTVKMTVLPSGNVGIGTTTPQAKLQVDGSVFINNAAAPGFYGQSAGTNKVYLGYDGAGTGLELYNFTSAKSLMIRDNGDLTYPGNVGIGTTTPYTTLTVGSTDATARITAGGPNTHLTLASAGPNGDIYLNAGGVASGNYSTSTRLSVGANGKVGIGTTTPSSNLTVNGATTCQIQIQSAGVSKGYLWWDSGSSKVGVGPGASNNSFLFNPSTSTVNFNGASCNGTDWISASDYRLKRDIQPMSKYGLSTVMQLKPVTYFYKADKTNHPVVGFIAQEVQKIVPEVVSGTEGDIDKGETLGLSYGNLVPVLVKAIQEQQKQIEALTKLVESLTTK